MTTRNPFSRETGAALITSLVFLTVLTILGMSTLGTALLESRMAGNIRDRNLAFQAAEIALRDAELYIRDSGRIVGLTEEGYDNTAGCTGVAGKECDAQLCKFGFCYNGGTMAASGTAWYAEDKAVWLDGETYWASALQYAHPDSTSGTNGSKRVGYSPRKAELDKLNVATGNCGQIPGSCNYSQPGLLPLVRRQPEYLIEAFEKDVSGNKFYYRITVRGYGMRPGTRVTLQEVYAP